MVRAKGYRVCGCIHVVSNEGMKATDQSVAIKTAGLLSLRPHVVEHNAHLLSSSSALPF